MAKAARRHHYLPQFYLKRFTGEDGLLCRFDRETKTFLRLSPLNTAVETDFYTVTDKQGVKSDCIEHLISKLESIAKDVIDRLDEGKIKWKDREERANFALFLALFHTRTPAFDKEQKAVAEHLYRAMNKANHPSTELTAQAFKEFEEATGEDMGDVDPGRVFQMIRDDEYTVEVPRAYIVQLLMESALDLAQVLMALNWTVARAPDDLAFVTSDAPFAIAPPPGETDWRAYGVLTPGSATTVPLSPNTCVVIFGEGGNDCYGRMRKDAVRRVNWNVAQTSDRFIIARDDQYLERLVKRTRTDQFQWTSRFEFDDVEIDKEILLNARRS